MSAGLERVRGEQENGALAAFARLSVQIEALQARGGEREDPKYVLALLDELVAVIHALKLGARDIHEQLWALHRGVTAISAYQDTNRLLPRRAGAKRGGRK